MPPTRGDGNLYISFVSMGQGDCTLVSLPNGRTMMIDCGTSRWDTDYNTGIDRAQSKKDQEQQIRQLRQEVIDTIYEGRFLHGYNTLDALILTHHDKDHCNELASVLKPNITIRALYHSGDITEYVEGGADWWLHNKPTLTAEYAITVNQNEQTINGSAIQNATNNTKIRRKSTAQATLGFVLILEGTNGGGRPCNVYILASNVEAYPNVSDGSTQINRGSVVTLIVYGNQKFLICGDATYNTEKFLIDTYNAGVERLSNLEVVQVGHHGSLTSSSHSTSVDGYISAIRFVNKVNPRVAIISAATDSGASLKLPRYETIQKYEACARMLLLNHNMSCWWYNDPVYRMVNNKRRLVTAGYDEFGQKALTKHILSTGDVGTVDVVRTDADVT